MSHSGQNSETESTIGDVANEVTFSTLGRESSSVLERHVENQARQPDSQAKAEPTRFTEGYLVRYQPLVVLLALSAVAAFALQGAPVDSFICLFLSISLLFFAALKLFNLRGFQTSFKEYDLVSARVPWYGFAYPFIELALALGFLMQFAASVLSIILIILMTITACGVVSALVQRKELECACTGSLVNVPLGAFSLIETLGMSLMALMYLGWTFW